MIWFIAGFTLGFLIAFEMGRVIYNRKMDEIQEIAERLTPTNKPKGK